MRQLAWVLVPAALLGSACGGDGKSGPDRVPPSYMVTEPVVFVALGGAGTLRVLKQSDLSTIANVNLRPGEMPHHLSLSSDHARLAVSLLPAAPVDGGTATTGKGEILVLNARTGEELANAVVPGVAENAAFLRDGRVVFADHMSNTVRFTQLNPATKTLEPQADALACTGPLEITQTLDQAMLLVACETSNTIGIIDVTTKTRVDVAVGTRPTAAWFGSDNRYYVTHAGSKELFIGGIGSTPMSFPLGFSAGQAITNPAMTEVAVTDRDAGRLVIYRTRDMLQLAAIPTAAGAVGVAWSSDGKRLFITNESAGSISSVAHPDGTTLTVEKSVDLGAGPNGILLLAP